MIIRWFRKPKVEEREPVCGQLVLNQTVRVADVLNHPDGGPLKVLLRGTLIEDIEQQYVDQLCDSHFTRIPTPDPLDATSE